MRKLSAPMAIWFDDIFAVRQCLSLLNYVIGASEKQTNKETLVEANNVVYADKDS